MKEQQIRQQMKALRKEVATLSVKRLIDRLDLGDKFYLTQLLDDLIMRVQYLHHLDKSTCSIVLEACGIEYGNRIKPPQLTHNQSEVAKA